MEKVKRIFWFLENMENKKEENKEIRIPIPNTRFLFTGIKKTDGFWSNGILDPITGERRTLPELNMSDPAMSLMISILTNKIFTNNKEN